MQKEKISIKKVKDLSYNPINKRFYDTTSNKAQEEQESLRISIKELGLLEPLIINNHNQVISGHRRLRALIDLGVESCNVRVITFENEILALLESNRQRELTTYEKATLWKEAEKELKKFKRLKKPFRRGDQVESTKETLNMYDVDTELSSSIGLGKSTMRKSKVIEKKDPILWDKVRTGDETINSAYKQVKTPAKPKSKRNQVQETQIKNVSKTLFKVYQKGQISLVDAYNISEEGFMGIREKRSKGTKDNKIGFKKEIKILDKRYKGKLEDYIEILKEMFPFTIKDHLK